MKTTGALTWAPRLALVALGFSCITTQLALLRELLAAFSGNEIILGIVLGFWLLLMGMGSWFGRVSEKASEPQFALAVFQLLLAIIPPAQVFLLRVLRNVVFIRGADVGITETILYCGLLLLPYCVPAGFALTLGCVVLARSRGPAGIGSGYVLDSIGTILGGFLFSLVFVHYFDHLRILAFPTALSFVSAAALGYCSRRVWFPAVTAAAGLGVVAIFCLVDLDEISSRLQFPGQRILARANSPYGRLLVTESDRQINFLENGIILTSTRDVEHVEETVHYAMAQRPEAGQVLLVSGGISGTAREILRYGARRLDYVELDPRVLELGRGYVPQNLADARLRIITTDPRLHLKAGHAQYDVIIVDLPPPSTAQLNRFYTAEFINEARRALAANGVLAFALGHYENYVSPELGRLLSCARRTLQSVFPNTLVIPGSRVFFLASEGPLYSDIATRLEGRGMKNQLVNRHYLEAMLAPDRLADVAQGSAQPTAINKDFSPVLYYLHLRHWMSQFSFTAGALQALFLIGLGVYTLRLRGNALILFASGFTASSLELVLLLAFQVLCGSVYHQVALIVTAFMGGLALGAWLCNRGVPESFESAGSPEPKPATLCQRPHAAGAEAGDAADLEVSALTKPQNPPGRATMTLSATHTKRNPLPLLALGLAAYSLALPPLLGLVKGLDGSPAALLAVKTAVCLMTAVLGAGIGAQFPLAVRREPGTAGRVVSRLYLADFLGAFLGAVLAGAIMIPIIGVFGVCILTGLLNALAALGAGCTEWRRSVKR